MYFIFKALYSVRYYGDVMNLCLLKFILTLKTVFLLFKKQISGIAKLVVLC